MSFIIFNKLIKKLKLELNYNNISETLKFIFKRMSL